MGVQNWCHNYRWGASAEDLLPGDSKNCSIPAKTSLPSSSSIHGYYCSWLYHVDERGTQTAATEFIQESPLFTDCRPDPRGPLPAAMVWRPLQAAQPPLPANKLFNVPSHLAQCGDIESNPGPKKERPPTKEQIMQGKVDSHETKLEELEVLVKSQAELIQELKSKQVELTSALDTKQTAQDVVLKEVQGEISIIKEKLDNGLSNIGSQSGDTTSKVKELQESIDDITEKVWELDKSWKNNLVFYGIKQDAGAEEHPSITEAKVREVILRKLRISRDVPVMRVKRTTNGPEVRGCKPVTVYFEKWQDKDEVLRKNNLLRGSNIYISEDFSKRVRDQRIELQKFAKLMRQRRPNSKLSMQYDKLIIDHEIYMFNDITGRVEEVGAGRSLSPGLPENYYLAGGGLSSAGGQNPDRSSANSERMRKRSSGRRKTSQKLQKSYSTESSLHHMVPSSPIYPEATRKISNESDIDYESESDSRQGSPVKTPKSRRERQAALNGGGTAPISPSKQPKMPLVEEEQEPPLTNGHHNTDDDNLQLNGEKNPSNGNGTIHEENGDSVSTFKTSEAVEAAPEAVEAPPAAPVDEAPPMVAAAE